MNEKLTCDSFTCTSLPRASPFSSPDAVWISRGVGWDRKEGGGRKLRVILIWLGALKPSRWSNLACLCVTLLLTC